MNRDQHPELGPRLRMGSMKDCLNAVLALYPDAYAEGSTGAERSFWVHGKLVAHAWPVRNVLSHDDPMWCRLKPLGQK